MMSPYAFDLIHAAFSAGICYGIVRGLDPWLDGFFSKND
jgi:hypothetical protein